MCTPFDVVDCRDVTNILVRMTRPTNYLRRLLLDFCFACLKKTSGRADAKAGVEMNQVSRYLGTWALSSSQNPTTYYL